MKYFRLLFLVPIVIIFQCASDNPNSFDNLDTTDLLGRWEIQDEIINGISDMIPKCCEFLEFEKDANNTDNKGLLTYTDAQGLVNNGIFEVNLENQTILFIDDDDDEFNFDFNVDNSQENLTINFIEDGNNYTQTWVRKE